MTYPSELYLLIDGERRVCDRDHQPVVNPATGETIGHVPHATANDLEDALAAAQRGFAIWRGKSALERSRVLRRTADLLRERRDSIAAMLTAEQGKPLAEARAELLNAADMFDWNAEEGRRIYGRIVPARTAGQRQTVLKEPVGPAALFTPWNFPASMPARKLSAALAAGCSAIIKPSEETPATALSLAEALQDAGLPPGVVGVVYGVPADISTILIQSPTIRKISFTGSTAVGKVLAGLAAEGVKRATMELGGHAPVLIFKDADLVATARAAVLAKFRNAGQVCISPTRFYVEDSVHDAFVENLVQQTEELVVGNGAAAGTSMGPLANTRRLDAMQRLISDALANGAALATGGRRIGNSGNFWAPTILAEVPETAEIMNVEPFGPVAVTARFSSFDEAVSAANRLPFGLAAYAFTDSSRVAARLMDSIEAGMLGINTFSVTVPETPFGGIKESGYGSEGGSEGLEPYLVTKLVSQA